MRDDTLSEFHRDTVAANFRNAPCHEVAIELLHVVPLAWVLVGVRPAWSEQAHCCPVDPLDEIILMPESLLPPSATGFPSSSHY